MAAAMHSPLATAACLKSSNRRTKLFKDVVLMASLACCLHFSAARVFDNGTSKKTEPNAGYGIFGGLGSDTDSQFHWNLKNAGGLVLACVCALLANSAGVGGGPLFMALFNGILGFSMTASTALSNTVIAASAIASTSYGLLQPSPLDPSTPLIDFTLALMFTPPLLVGVGIGVLLNVLFPEWLQTLGLLVLLVFVVRRTWLKALQTWNAETVLRNYQPAPSPPPPSAQVADGEGDQPDGTDRTADNGDESSTDKSTARPSASGPLQRVQRVMGPLSVIAVLWVVFLSFQLALDHHNRCTWQYALLWAGQTGMCLAFTAFMVRQQLAGQGGGDLAAPLLGSSGPDNTDKLLKVIGAMAIAGVAAGLLGIGGALVFNPFLLALGVHPQVTASTAVMMILFSSSSVSLSFFFKGLLNTSFATVFAPACFASSLLGVTIVGRIIKRTGRASIIIFILTGLLAAGTIITCIFGGVRSYRDISEGTDVGFKPFCGE